VRHEHFRRSGGGPIHLRQKPVRERKLIGSSGDGERVVRRFREGDANIADSPHRIRDLLHLLRIFGVGESENTRLVRGLRSRKRGEDGCENGSVQHRVVSPVMTEGGARVWRGVRTRLWSYNWHMTLKPPFDRITIEPDKMGGQPCIRGLRITVRRVLEIVAAYPDRKELFLDYPDLEDGDLQQALAFAAAHLDDQIEILDYAS
jgi:uncharacterized protein (DUF433 family)